MISSQAFIHPEAKIGKDVIIEPFAYVGANVEIGDGTWLGPNSTIFEGARLGKKCRVFPGAVVSAIPQDLKFIGEDTITVIGDSTTIRESVTVNRGTSATGKTVVGSDCLLMANAHVAHDCVVGDHCILVNSVALGGEVTLGDWTIIGGLSAVHQFVHIGAHAMIGGGAIVRKDVPPFIIVNPKNISFSGINKIGLSRRGYSDEQIAEIHNIYRIIYQNNMNTSQALDHIRQNFKASTERDLIIDFILSASRGIIRS